MAQQVLLLGGVRLRVTEYSDGTYAFQVDSNGAGTTVPFEWGGARLAARDNGDGTATLRVMKV